MTMVISERANLKSMLEHVDMASFDVNKTAQVLARLQSNNDADSLRALRDAYVVGLSRWHAAKGTDEIRRMADSNLLKAADTADAYSSDGFSSTDLILSTFLHDGPVAQFYRKVTGYNPLQ